MERFLAVPIDLDALFMGVFVAAGILTDGVFGVTDAFFAVTDAFFAVTGAFFGIADGFFGVKDGFFTRFTAVFFDVFLTFFTTIGFAIVSR